MKNSGKIIGGLCLIAAALLIIFEQLDVIDITLSSGRIIISVIAFAIMFGGIKERNFFGLFLGLGILWLVLGESLNLPQIGVWQTLLVVFLLSTGFQIIFPAKGHSDEKWEAYDDGHQIGEHQKVKDSQEGGFYTCSNKFGQLEREFNTKDFKGASLSNQFGETRLDLSNTEMTDSSANLKVDNSFGSIVVYVPSGWDVKLNVNVFAADCKTYTTANPGGPVLNVTGSVNFGNVIIQYR